MSHFTVAVVTKTLPDEEMLTKALAPYREFECSGEVDEYVKEIDITEKAHSEYTERIETVNVSESGEKVSAYDDRFYRPLTPEEVEKYGRTIMGTGGDGVNSWHSRDWDDGKGYSTRMLYVPEGWTRAEMKTAEVKSFRDFIEGWYEYTEIKPGKKPDLHGDEKYGWVELDDAGNVLRVVKRTIPESKWDWWVVGGRWSGMLKLKQGPSEGAWNGRRSVFDNETPKKGCYDSARKGLIDFDTIRMEARINAGLKYDKVRAAIDAHLENFVGWEDLLNSKTEDEKKDMPSIRTFYHSQPAVKAFREVDDAWGGVEEYLVSRDAYTQKAEDDAFCTFALLDENGWHQRGNMHMFAVVSDENAEWNNTFRKYIDELDENSWITIVDCHV